MFITAVCVIFLIKSQDWVSRACGVEVTKETGKISFKQIFSFQSPLTKKIKIICNENGSSQVFGSVYIVIIRDNLTRLAITSWSFWFKKMRDLEAFVSFNFSIRRSYISTLYGRNCAKIDSNRKSLSCACVLPRSQKN